MAHLTTVTLRLAASALPLLALTACSASGPEDGADAPQQAAATPAPIDYAAWETEIEEQMGNSVKFD